MKYRHLTLEQRYQLASLLSIKVSKREIATRIGVHRSTIFRELKRNKRPLDYGPKSAHEKYFDRRSVKSEKTRKIQGALKNLVETKLQFGWSPEQICGRLRVENGLRISHETIYQHILRDFRSRGWLRYCLRFRGYKFHRFKRSRYRIKNPRLNFRNRPTEANERSELGHWERDLVLGRRGGACLLTMVDRKSRYTRIEWVKSSAVNRVDSATQKVLKDFRDVNKTMTNDNGSEFSNLKALDIPIYFTDPSSPWQRGSIENANGLVRQYFQKGDALEKYDPRICKAIEETLNHRPRKTLNYQTPYEVQMSKKTSLLQSHFGLKTSSIT